MIEAMLQLPGIDKCFVKRLMVDTGASRNVLFYKCFEAMGLKSRQLVLCATRLEGFTTHKVDIKGTIEIEVSLGMLPQTRYEMIKFHVVDVDSVYNAILGTSLHAKFNMVVSLPHQRVKFLTSVGIGEIKSNLRSLLTYLVKTKKKQILLTVQPVSKEQLMVITPEYNEIMINPQYPEQKIKVGGEMPEEEVAALEAFLKNHCDNFAWMAEDMLGLDNKVALHKLNTDPKMMPIQQKQRRFSPDKEVGMKDEIHKLLQARFIWEVQYPT